MNAHDRIKRRLAVIDPDVAKAIHDETDRLEHQLELIASENFVSEAVLEAMGSVFTNKYAEGYPGKRYYGGCEYVDVVESLARDRAKQLFQADHANVQPHSGTQANIATYMACMRPGDTLMGMDLSHGGHLSHGHPLNFSGQMYKVVFYGVDKDTEILDYDQLDALADQNHPKVIMVGASAYSRFIDFPRFRATCDRVGAKMIVDIAHIAGLVAANLHPSPVPHADFVTSTTHKTLRGPRGGLVLCKEAFVKELDRQVFPGHQGGPLVHIIAAKAVCFKEAMEPEFVEYQRQIRANAASLCKVIAEHGYRIVSGGTDNHLFLVDVFSKGITGKQAQIALDRAGITVNKNTIPFDKNPPLIASGIRVGTPALTTRGMKEPEMQLVGEMIVEVLNRVDDESVQNAVREKVSDLATRFPLYAHRL